MAGELWIQDHQQSFSDTGPLRGSTAGLVWVALSAWTVAVLLLGVCVGRARNRPSPASTTRQAASPIREGSYLRRRHG